MKKLGLKNYLDRETQGLVKGDLTTLELCCSPTLPLPQLTPSPRNFQTRIQKKHSNQLSMSSSSSSSQCYRGCPEQPRASRHDVGEEVPCPGGVLYCQAPAQASLPSGLLGWGCQPCRRCRPFRAILTAAEPIQWRNYTCASGAEAKQPESTPSPPKDASWLLAAQNYQSTELLALNSHGP